MRSCRSATWRSCRSPVLCTGRVLIAGLTAVCRGGRILAQGQLVGKWREGACRRGQAGPQAGAQPGPVVASTRSEQHRRLATAAKHLHAGKKELAGAPSSLCALCHPCRPFSGAPPRRWCSGRGAGGIQPEHQRHRCQPSGVPAADAATTQPGFAPAGPTDAALGWSDGAGGEGSGRASVRVGSAGASVSVCGRQSC